MSLLQGKAVVGEGITAPETDLEGVEGEVVALEVKEEVSEVEWSENGQKQSIERIPDIASRLLAGVCWRAKPLLDK